MKLIIIGNSGHKKVVSEVAEQLGYTIVGIIDDAFDSRFSEEDILYGNTKHIHDMIRETGARLFFGIGNNKVRQLIIEREHLSNEMFVTLISPHAIISKSAHIGIGTLVMPGAIINVDAKIGTQVIINSGAIVEHDCVVSDYAHISPHATLTGAVNVGRGTQIGALAVVNTTVTVGDWVTIGSGASVVRDIQSNTVAVGVPAKIIKTL
ncbi:acetyltransferase [Macrococcus animalis]|uniref:acetyltransferase n=1 Tax=Macrococcus animalis TaxID=3395467 RepID=UPI0039BE1F10